MTASMMPLVFIRERIWGLADTRNKLLLSIYTYRAFSTSR
jgi:hypothetical protein